jgi:hypothetical protein
MPNLLKIGGFGGGVAERSCCHDTCTVGRGLAADQFGAGADRHDASGGLVSEDLPRPR